MYCFKECCGKGGKARTPRSKKTTRLLQLSYMNEAIPKTSSVNRERINELKNYYNEERARHLEKVRSDRGKSQSELGRPADSDGSTAGGRNSQDSAVGGGSERTDTKGNVERDSSRSEQSGSKIKEFRSKNGEVYEFTVDGKMLSMRASKLRFILTTIRVRTEHAA